MTVCSDQDGDDLCVMNQKRTLFFSEQLALLLIWDKTRLSQIKCFFQTHKAVLLNLNLVELQIQLALDLLLLNSILQHT